MITYCPFLPTQLVTWEFSMVLPFFKLYVSSVPTLFSRVVHLVVLVGHSEIGRDAPCLDAAQNPTFAADGSITTLPSLPPDAPLNRWLGSLTKYVRSLQLSGVPKDVALPIVVEDNVKMQVENICKTQTMTDIWSSNASNKKEVWVHGLVYDLASGRLRDLGISRGPPGSS